MLNANALEGFIFLCVSNEEELMNEMEGVSLGVYRSGIAGISICSGGAAAGDWCKVIEWHTIRKVKGKHERNLKGK